MKLNRIIGAALASVAGVVGVGACGGGDKAPSFSAADAAHFVQHQLSFRAAAADTLPAVFRTLDETVPNVTYIRPDRGPGTVTDLVVVGTITDVKKGRAMVVGGEDAPGGTAKDFDAKDARWWLVHATVTVERTIGSGDTPEEVTVALPLDAPHEFQKMAAGLKALGRVVFFLDKDTPHTEYDPSLYVVIGNHAYIASVDTDGGLSLPFVEAEAAGKLLAGITTLADLEARAGQPRTVILKTGDGPFYVRAEPLAVP